jgi:Reverse transcriptase (RNA-dependent DNA polymerase)
MSRLHPVFNVVKLLPAPEDPIPGRRALPPPPLELDDILIFTKTLAEHRRILQLVLKRLRLHRLYLCPEKCKFERTRIEYLGLIVSQGKVEMDPVKVSGVMDWPVPKNRKKVQAFLGLANFYWWLIEGFSHHAQPLFDQHGLGENANSGLSMGSSNDSRLPQSSSLPMTTCLTGWKQTAQMSQQVQCFRRSLPRTTSGIRSPSIPRV